MHHVQVGSQANINIIGLSIIAQTTAPNGHIILISIAQTHNKISNALNASKQWYKPAYKNNNPKFTQHWKFPTNKPNNSNKNIDKKSNLIVKSSLEWTRNLNLIMEEEMIIKGKVGIKQKNWFKIIQHK